MKRIICFLFFIFLLLPVFSQKQNIAVYITGDPMVGESVLQVIASELVSGFATDERYNAVERTTDFLRTIKQEQNYQNSGNVDDSQICELGKQFGADLVCTINVLPFKDQYYCNARLVDVKTATIVSSIREMSALNSLDDIVVLSDKLVYTLTGKKTQELKEVEQRQRDAKQQEEVERIKQINHKMISTVGDAVIGILKSSDEMNNPYYTLKVCNLRQHTRKVYADGTYIGEVPSGRTVLFKVPLDWWHKYILVQKNGYVFQASKESYSGKERPRPGETITIIDQ